ncbi:hypothetical protein [Variovorax sp.]|jgi:hypothetical protein|uniref:hypothetical protein n=1 Tax=Variovorax sp. TaxID=1871043 RepID=UPI0012027336|nr:hypothetical protein [Variovorax sp.]TAJ62028.1 MAG: hypothetical protein EPO53_19915 [Variovorax sp.]
MNSRDIADMYMLKLVSDPFGLKPHAMQMLARGLDHFQLGARRYKLGDRLLEIDIGISLESNSGL